MIVVYVRYNKVKIAKKEKEKGKDVDDMVYEAKTYKRALMLYI